MFLCLGVLFRLMNNIVYIVPTSFPKNCEQKIPGEYKRTTNPTQPTQPTQQRWRFTSLRCWCSCTSRRYASWKPGTSQCLHPTRPGNEWEVQRVGPKSPVITRVKELHLTYFMNKKPVKLWSPFFRPFIRWTKINLDLTSGVVGAHFAGGKPFWMWGSRHQKRLIYLNLYTSYITSFTPLICMTYTSYTSYW